MYITDVCQNDRNEKLSVPGHAPRTKLSLYDLNEYDSK